MPFGTGQFGAGIFGANNNATIPSFLGRIELDAFRDPYDRLLWVQPVTFTTQAGALLSLTADRAGTKPLPNPVFTDQYGRLPFELFGLSQDAVQVIAGGQLVAVIDLQPGMSDLQKEIAGMSYNPTTNSFVLTGASQGTTAPASPAYGTEYELTLAAAGSSALVAPTSPCAVGFKVDVTSTASLTVTPPTGFTIDGGANFVVGPGQEFTFFWAGGTTNKTFAVK